MKVLVLFFLLIATAYGQSDIATGQNEASVGMPVGVKIFDIGFRKVEYLNVASCRKTLYILIRFSQGAFQERVVNFQIKTGVPKSDLPRKVGLYKIDSLSAAQINGLNFVTHRDVTHGDKFFLLKTSYASYVAQVYGLDKNGAIIQRSQILYIRQQER